MVRFHRLVERYGIKLKNSRMLDEFLSEIIEEYWHDEAPRSQVVDILCAVQHEAPHLRHKGNATTKCANVRDRTLQRRSAPQHAETQSTAHLPTTGANHSTQQETALQPKVRGNNAHKVSTTTVKEKSAHNTG